MLEKPITPANTGKALVVLGPLPVYAAKPYAYLPASMGVVEYVPERSALRWLREVARPLPDEWGLRRVSLPVPVGLRRLSWPLQSLARRVLPPEVSSARAVVLTSPFQSGFRGIFAGTPLYYHAFDDYESYGWTDETLLEREAEILSHSQHVFVVSDALARVYRDRHRVPLSRITIVPNGFDPSLPSPAPPDLARISRPLIGTLGNVNERLRLDWVLEILEALPWASWAFVGRVHEAGPPDFHAALSRLRRHPRCVFLGAKPYAELHAYAAAFDVAVFPLGDHALNRASSPTRFFSQLPFGQPILVTDQCEQLVDMQPMTRVCTSATAFIVALEALREVKFQDGHASTRVRYSRECTWAARARQLEAAFEAVGHPVAAPGRREP